MVYKLFEVFYLMQLLRTDHYTHNNTHDHIFDNDAIKEVYLKIKIKH